MYIYVYICVYMYRLSYERRGDISFIARETISYFVSRDDIIFCHKPRSLRSLVTKYDIVSRAIKLISPRLSYDNLYLSHTCAFI